MGPLDEPRQRGRLAEVFAANKEYARTNTWDSPSAVVLTDEDHESGVHWMPCRDCCGTSHFPVPWEARDKPGSDFCVACKGTRLEPVMA